jgi:hypothetical protein
MKNIVASGFFLVTLFIAVEEKVTGSKGFESKTIQDDGAKRALRDRGQVACFAMLLEGNKKINKTYILAIKSRHLIRLI